MTFQMATFLRQAEKFPVTRRRDVRGFLNYLVLIFLENLELPSFRQQLLNSRFGRFFKYSGLKCKWLSKNWLSKTLSKQIIRFITLFLAFVGLFGPRVLLAVDVYVSPMSSESGDGSRSKPFRTLQEALARVEAGDTLWFGEGRYEESLKLSKKKNLRILPMDGALAVIDGTKEMPKAWVPHGNGVWKQVLDFEPYQLFHDDALVYVARWPNASFEDGSIWRMMRCMRSSDGGWDKHKNRWVGKTRFGLIYDDCFHRPETPGFREGDSRYQVDPKISFQDQPASLVETGKDFTGCVAVLNIGHWRTWARRITDHGIGQDHFSYDTQGLPKDQVQKFSAYHILGLAALDRPNEWWFDFASKTVYYMPPAGKDPNLMDLRGRIRDFGVDLDHCSGIEISGLNFHAAGFWLKECDGVSLSDCRFHYPATHKFVHGDFQFVAAWNPSSNGNVMPSFFGGKRNVFANNILRWCNAPVYLGSEGMVVENCLFSDIEWEVNSNGGSGAVMIGKDGIFRRNTITRCGNSEGLRAVGEGVTMQYNHLSDMSNLQHDGSALNVGTTKHHKVLVSHNWAHDCNRQGMRFDYHGSGIRRQDGQLFGDGVYMNNVTWNTTDNEVKGDRHLILNNTVLNNNHYPDVFSEPVTMSIQGFMVMHEIYSNAESLIRNNLGTLRSRSFHLEDEPRPWWKRSDGSTMPVATVLPGKNDHNFSEKGAAWKYLRDPANYDFRPKANSPLIDAGAPVNKNELPSMVANFPGQKYVGSAPDIGAYEYGDSRYWIPGRLETTATMPVPKNGGKSVPLNTDLMFLEAYQAEEHIVLFGEKPTELAVIASLNGTGTNIVKPPKLLRNTTYYWQVRAVTESGTATRSPIWTFTTTE